MAFIFLALIYIAFISLGLPDSMLGAAWPAMRAELGMPLQSAGIISIIITCGTIISSLLSEKLLRRFGTGKVTIVSVALTAFAITGIAFTHNFYVLCVLAIPLGIGGGSVDAGLNNFVALHYKARQMNWLHSFWGIGATSGPLILSLALSVGGKWQTGYLYVGIIQIGVVILLFASLPLWKKYEPTPPGLERVKDDGKTSIFKLSGAIPAVAAFFLYCAAETTAGLWGASYLVEVKGLDPAIAAVCSSAFYIGIAGGRLLSGFVSMLLSSRKLIIIGEILCFSGAILLILPFPAYISAVGLVIIGLGCAPIYPGMLHETPRRFGKDASAHLIGIEMACAYIGNMFVPVIIGQLGANLGLWIFPIAILICDVMMFFCTELTETLVRKAHHLTK